jgi:hypothetical protein
LKQIKGGRVEEYPVDAVLKYLTEGMTPGAWLKACMEETSISRKTFYRRVSDAAQAGQIIREGKLWRIKA